MNKYLSITLKVLLVLAALVFCHWLSWDQNEPFFKFGSQEVFNAVLILVGALVSALCRKNSMVSLWYSKYEQAIRSKAFLLISLTFLTILFACVLMHGGTEDIPLSKMIIYVLAFLFFGGTLIYFLWTIFGPKKSPQYDTDSQYLYILFKFNRTPVEWKHITHFSIEDVREASNQKFIAVHVDNAEDLMANETGMLKRKGYEMYIPQYGTPYFIPTERCVLTPEQLLDQLNQELAHHKHGASS